MSDEQRERERDEEEPRRPRVVDKRISARPPGEAAPAAPPRPAEPAAEVTPEPPPVAPEGEAGETFRPPPTDASGAGPGGEVWTPEQEAEAKRMVEEIGRVPSRDWVVSAAMNLVNVAGVKLDRGDTAEAQLAIDALAGILDKAGPRLGDAQGPLKQVLAQLQMAFAEVTRGAAPGTAAPPV